MKFTEALIDGGMSVTSSYNNEVIAELKRVCPPFLEEQLGEALKRKPVSLDSQNDPSDNQLILF